MEKKQIRITLWWPIRVLRWLGIYFKSTAMYVHNSPDGREDQPITVGFYNLDSMGAASTDYVFVHAVHLSIPEARRAAKNITELCDQRETWPK